MSALLVLAGTLALTPVSPSATAASYCSRSGDVCYGVKREQGAIVLRINTVARYFDRYRLCITDPRPRRVCRTYRIVKSGKIYGSSVRWARNFPNAGSGVYRASWHALGNRLGPVLTFRVGG